jgi:pilus assembly protein CpaF
MSAVVGYGPLERWLNDPDVDEVLVNGGSDVWVERRGTSGPVFAGRVDPATLLTIIERMLAPTGRRVDRTTPMVDARLPDGSRVCAALPPVAIDGPCLAVRRFRVHDVEVSDFADEPVARLLAHAVLRRCNLIVSGATSSGKTTMLNALTSWLPLDERVITLEDTAELRLRTPHVLRLETRPPSVDGPAPLDMTALVRLALRLRPDRLVIGEIRGDEAADLVQAFNTGHDGSLATLHANGPTDALARLESLVVRAQPGWALPAVRDQVRRSVDVVVHLGRDRTGRRTVTEVAEVQLPDPTSGSAGPAVRHVVRDGAVVGELTRGRR